MNLDLGSINFSNLSGGEIAGMVLGVVGLMLGGAFLIKTWLDKTE